MSIVNTLHMGIRSNIVLFLFPSPSSSSGSSSQVAFADPAKKVGFGFVRNGLEVKMHSMHHTDLVDATYHCVEQLGGGGASKL